MSLASPALGCVTMALVILVGVSSSLFKRLQESDMKKTRLLRFPQVREMTGLSRTTVWRMERDGKFPKHRKISARMVCWVEDEVLLWISKIIH